METGEGLGYIVLTIFILKKASLFTKKGFQNVKNVKLPNLSQEG